MSDSGPVPRSHSPLVWVRLSRFIRGFLLSNQVAQAGGLFVGFALDGVAQLLPQFAQFRLLRGVRQGVRRHLADVAAPRWMRSSSGPGAARGTPRNRADSPAGPRP